MRLKSYKTFILLLLAVIIVCLLMYGRYVEPDAIRIREINVDQISIPSSLKGKKIVHLSDLHISDFGENESYILKTVKRLNPDLIFLTGDYIQWRGNNRSAIRFLAELNAKYGVYAVMGDYDYSDSKNSCLFCHEKGTGKPTKEHDITMLRNSEHHIAIDGQVLKIIGIDERYGESLPGAKENTIRDQNLFSLVLSHSPLSFDTFSNQDRVFMFAGDTHGGQINLPIWVYQLFGYEKNVKYNYGLFRKGEKLMYVTRGIGTSHFRIRLFCPPEIAVFQF